MAGPNNPKSVNPEDLTESTPIELGSVREATRRLAITVATTLALSGVAQAQTSPDRPTQVEATTVPPSHTRTPSASATPSADNWGGQTVTINGRTLTFSAISQLPKEERTPILKELGKIGLLQTYQEWRILVAENKDQEIKIIDGNIQVANQEATKLDIENIEKMRSKLARGVKLNGADREYLESIARSNRAPVNSIAKEILEKRENFA